MREFHKILDVTAIKPVDWVLDLRVVLKEEVPAKVLTSFTQEEKHLIFKRKILVVLPKKGPPRKGRFLSEEEKDVFWLIKDQQGSVLGPFTSKEMQSKADEGKLTNSYIKRDDDKDFIEFDLISKTVENVFDLSSFDKFLTSKSNSKSPERDILFVDEKKTNEKNNVFSVENNGTFPKSKAFLRKRNCQIDVQSIIQRIYGKTRTNAINILCFLISTMNKQDCEQLLDLLVRESGKEILADSADGFIKVMKKNFKR